MHRCDDAGVIVSGRYLKGVKIEMVGAVQSDNSIR